MRIPLRIALAVIVASFAVSGLAVNKPRAQTAGPGPARVTQLLQNSGYNFVQKTPTVWYIDFTGKSLKNFRVILSTTDDNSLDGLVVIFVTVTQKAKMPVTTDFMSRMLHLNHTLDRVKVGFDNDGDLSVRSDCTIRVLDGAEFKVQVEQVAAAANEVYETAQPYLLGN